MNIISMIFDFYDKIGPDPMDFGERVAVISSLVLSAGYACPHRQCLAWPLVSHSCSCKGVKVAARAAAYS